MRVAIVSASELPHPDPDEGPLVAALAARGADTRVLAWDDGASAFEEVDVAVIRSTWNYVSRREAFCAWADATQAVTRLLNPADVVRQNTDKIYLRDLERLGLPVVPTVFVDTVDDAASALARASERGWKDLVVKPRISAGSFATRRFSADPLSEAESFLREQLLERPMMIQPYQPAVEDSGERALVWIDGAFTHATRKSPRFSGDDPNISEPMPIADDELALATRAMAHLAERLLYARVDLVRDEDGSPRIMEIELTEPYLMLGSAPHALARLADAILNRCVGADRSRSS